MDGNYLPMNMRSLQANMNLSPLLTDFYQLTMAYGYWQLGMQDTRAAFHLLFRKTPFKGNYCLSAGLESALEFLQSWCFTEDEIHYLNTLKNPGGDALFSKKFLNYLQHLHLSLDVFAIPEGTIVFANTPLLRVEGPILQCQLVESALLNFINFQTLITTKASRVFLAAEGDEVIEFGLRRAQGPNGALFASRAAYIGGASSTSNTLAGQCYGIPVKGTHAHSWVSAFSTEREAFTAYLTAMPEHSVLLVDTYNTMDGINTAIAVGQEMQQKGIKLSGVRLDSGDLAGLSIDAREALDAAGFKDTKIIASNSLDEYVITSLKQQGAKIDAWGVGTNLVTAFDQAALDGVYKLSALQDAHGKWQYKLKLSNQEVKVSNPGRHQVRRYFFNEAYTIDVIYDLELGIDDVAEVVILDEPSTHKTLDDYDSYVELLEPVMVEGQATKPGEPLSAIRDKATEEVKRFKASQGDKPYIVAMEKKLFEIKQQLIKKYRGEHA